MEEKKCRRRSLRNLRRSSSSWVVPSEAVLRGIEIERENFGIISAYGSAWLGEDTVQGIVTHGQQRSEEEAMKGFFPAIDDCATDESSPMPSKIMKNSDWPQPVVRPCETQKEMQCANRIKFENIHNVSAASSSSSSLQDSEKIKLSFLSNHSSVVDHNRAQNTNLMCTSSSSKVSLTNQNSSNGVHKLKPQKKEGSLNFSFNLQQTKAKPNGSSGAPPSFLKTTQSFVLKHSVANNTQSVKSSVNCVRPAKATKVGNLHSPSKTAHFVTIQSKPLLFSAVRKNVQPDSQNSTSKLNAVKPATSKDHNVKREREKTKNRKRLSLRKSITADPGLSDSIMAGSSSAEKDKDVKGNSSGSTQFLTNSVIPSENELDKEKLNIHNVVGGQILEDFKTFRNGDFDFEMTEELLKSFDLPLFPSSETIQQAKEKDTRKSLLRTSRYFSPFEMPLSKPSLEDEHESLDSLGTSVKDSPFTMSPSDEEKTTIDIEPTSLKGLLTEDCPNEKSSMEDPVHHMTPVQNTSAVVSVGMDTEVSPLCNNIENKENMTEGNNKINSLGKNYFYEANTRLINEMMDDFKNMSVVEALKEDEKLKVNEKTPSRSLDISFDVNGNRRDSETFETIITNNAALPNGLTQPVGSGQISPVKISPTVIDDQVEMMELTSDKNNSSYTDNEVEMTEHELCPGDPIDADNIDNNIFDMDSVSSLNVKRTLRSRKSWDFSQITQPQKESKSARKRNSEGPSSASSRSKKRPAESRTTVSLKTVEKEISPGLRDLYTNKNYVLPKAKMWETIKESPQGDHLLFTKQKYKRFLQFEAGVTTSKLQRRHKKAAEVKKKLAVEPVSLSDEEFCRKLLDVQLLLD